MVRLVFFLNITKLALVICNSNQYTSYFTYRLQVVLLVYFFIDLDSFVFLRSKKTNILFCLTCYDLKLVGILFIFIRFQQASVNFSHVACWKLFKSWKIKDLKNQNYLQDAQLAMMIYFKQLESVGFLKM